MKILSSLFSSGKDAATGQSEGFSSAANWPYWVAALVLVALLVLLVYMLRKHRKSALVENGDKAEKKEKPKRVPVPRLARVWKGFLREIPWELRRTVKVYQHFVVFGESGSGKSNLIDNQTDWQGHARQFYPSYTTSELLQFYLGSKVLVQEIPSDLLNDTSKQARIGLRKLWKPLFRRKDPTVVIVLNGAMLQAGEQEHLKREAQIIRGKINLLSRIRKKPVKVRVALTHMDQFEGFCEFSEFLTRHNIPLKLQFDSKDDLKDLAVCLQPYEDHLTRALASLPAEQYLKAITFMRQAPRLFQCLSVYLNFLQSPDPLSSEPQITNLCLAAQSESKTRVSNPFATSLTAEELQKHNPLFRHRVAAIALGVAGLVYLGAAFVYEYRLIDERYREMALLEAEPPTKYDQSMHGLFVDPLTNMQRNTMMKFLPEFFPNINQELNRRCVENIRRFYLFPELDRFSVEAGNSGGQSSGTLSEVRNLQKQHSGEIEDAQDKVLYLLALIYSTRDNQLGTLVRENLEQWTDILKLPATLIEDYVNNNTSSDHVNLNVDQYTYRQTKSIADDPHALMVYFVKVSRLYQQPVISRHEFEGLQKETGSFLQVINQLERYDLSTRVSDLLREETPLGITLNLIAREDSQFKQEMLKAFLTFIKGSGIDHPGVGDDLNLAGLKENLKVMLHFKGRDEETQTLFHFIFGGEEFKFSARRWNELLNRSRITFYLQDFIRQNKRNDGLLFFDGGHEFDDLVMNSSNDGRFLFTGHSRVDGRFTQEALEQRVRPMLTELPEFIGDLPIQQTEKDRFSNFLFQEAEAYGRRYAEAFHNYYMEFDIKADSPGALNYILRQLTLPSSPLVDILQSVKDNTLVVPDKNEYLRAIAANLAPFEFSQRLMEDHKGTHPELDKYRALLDQMQFEIRQQQAGAGKVTDATLDSFKNRLSPLGRISLAIFMDEPDSYLNLIRMWIKSVGIPQQWEAVFLAPVWQAYYLGLAEVEREIAGIWDQLHRTDIAPLQNRFPFDASSSKDVSIQSLTRATHPEGPFWEHFNRLLAPMFVKDKGLLRERPSAFDAPRLPQNMLETVNALAGLTRILWDQNGEERPLEFMIRPVSLPTARPDEPVVVLSYLHAGESPVFGFNQQPAWKKIRINWQKECDAAVGVEFAIQDHSKRLQETITVPKTTWSFYHLLKRAADADSLVDDAEPGAPRTLSWMINSPEMPSGGWNPLAGSNKKAESRPLDVRFAMKDDPWELFRLPN